MDIREITTKTGNTYSFYRIDNDYYGNPRYLVHFSNLGLKKHKSDKKTRAAGLRIYHGKLYGGGFSFQSYNLQDTAEWFEKCGLYRS